jgi:hypothetical protein
MRMINGFSSFFVVAAAFDFAAAAFDFAAAAFDFAAAVVERHAYQSSSSNDRPLARRRFTCVAHVRCEV